MVPKVLSEIETLKAKLKRGALLNWIFRRHYSSCQIFWQSDAHLDYLLKPPHRCPARRLFRLHTDTSEVEPALWKTSRLQRLVTIFCETSPSCEYSMRALWRLRQQPKPCSKEIIWLPRHRWEPSSSDIIHGTNPCRARWTSGPWWVDHWWTRDEDEEDAAGTD